MNAKHTPGPWEAVIYGGFDAPRVFGCGGSVALLQHHASGPQEAEANARLIAAAPDLLEALHQIARANEFDVSRGRQCAEEMRQIAKTAIAKATGATDDQPT